MSTNASSLPCQFPVFGGLHSSRCDNDIFHIQYSPSIDVVVPGQSVLPEQQPSVAGQGSEHEQNAGDDPS